MRVKFVVLLDRANVESETTHEVAAMASDSRQTVPSFFVAEITAFDLTHYVFDQAMEGDETRSLRPSSLLLLSGFAGDEDAVAGAAERIRDLDDVIVAFRAREHVALHGSGRGQGDETVTRFAFGRRQPHLDRKSFGDHWAHSHAPLVVRNRPLFDRYVVNVAVDDAPWDGVAEQRFPTTAALLEHDRLIREGKPEVAADIARFIGSCDIFVGDEVDHLDSSPHGRRR